MRHFLFFICMSVFLGIVTAPEARAQQPDLEVIQQMRESGFLIEIDQSTLLTFQARPNGSFDVIVRGIEVAGDQCQNFRHPRKSITTSKCEIADLDLHETFLNRLSSGTASMEEIEAHTGIDFSGVLASPDGNFGAIFFSSNLSLSQKFVSNVVDIARKCFFILERSKTALPPFERSMCRDAKLASEIISAELAGEAKTEAARRVAEEKIAQASAEREQALAELEEARARAELSRKKLEFIRELLAIASQ